MFPVLICLILLIREVVTKVIILHEHNFEVIISSFDYVAVLFFDSSPIDSSDHAVHVWNAAAEAFEDTRTLSSEYKHVALAAVQFLIYVLLYFCII
jgi:hypothetical protein